MFCDSLREVPLSLIFLIGISNSFAVRCHVLCFPVFFSQLSHSLCNWRVLSFRHTFAFFPNTSPWMCSLKFRVHFCKFTPGGGSPIWKGRVSLRGINHTFWSHLGSWLQNTSIFISQSRFYCAFDNKIITKNALISVFRLVFRRSLDSGLLARVSNLALPRFYWNLLAVK